MLEYNNIKELMGNGELGSSRYSILVLNPGIESKTQAELNSTIIEMYGEEHLPRFKDGVKFNDQIGTEYTVGSIFAKVVIELLQEYILILGRDNVKYNMTLTEIVNKLENDERFKIRCSFIKHYLDNNLYIDDSIWIDMPKDLIIESITVRHMQKQNVQNRLINPVDTTMCIKGLYNLPKAFNQMYNSYIESRLVDLNVECALDSEIMILLELLFPGFYSNTKEVRVDKISKFSKDLLDNVPDHLLTTTLTSTECVSITCNTILDCVDALLRSVDLVSKTKVDLKQVVDLILSGEDKGKHLQASYIKYYMDLYNLDLSDVWLDWDLEIIQMTIFSRLLRVIGGDNQAV